MQFDIMGQSIQNDYSHLPLINGNNNDTNTSEDDIIDNSNEVKKNRKEVYGKGNEAKLIKEKLGDFDVFHSESYQKFNQQFGRSVRLTEILAILSSIEIFLQIKRNIILPKITRNEKRSIPLLFKYIEQNREFILPYLHCVSLCDSSFQKIQVDN